MPGFNQTGPQGFGPGTGRGIGPCGGGMRRQGSGAGRGMCRRFGGMRYSPMIQGSQSVDERTWLNEEAAALEQALTDVRKRIDTLNTKE